MDDVKNPPAGNRNLGRAEAAERARILAVDSYQVHLDLSGARDPERSGFPSLTRISFSCSEPGAETFLDFIAEGRVQARFRQAHCLRQFVQGSVLVAVLPENLHRPVQGVIDIEGAWAGAVVVLADQRLL